MGLYSSFWGELVEKSASAQFFNGRYRVSKVLLAERFAQLREILRGGRQLCVAGRNDDWKIRPVGLDLLSKLKPVMLGIAWSVMSPARPCRMSLRGALMVELAPRSRAFACISMTRSSRSWAIPHALSVAKSFRRR